MKRIINFLRGTIRLRVSGVELERFLNLCARERLTFWDADREEIFSLCLRVTRKDLKRLRGAAQKMQCSVEILETKGLPFFLSRFRGRYALIAGLLFFCVALFIGSRTLFVIDIYGNENMSKQEILSALRQHGIHPGIYTPSVERGILCNNILLDMDDLSFIAINFHGIRAEVIVREKVPVPPVVDEKQLTDVVSTATGIITRMEVLAGDPLVDEGQTVLKGEVLIRGLVEIPGPKLSETILGVTPTHAQGRIYARTWHTLKAKIPLDAQVKQHSGEEKSRYALNILGKRVNLYQNGRISFAKYDKITQSRTWLLPDGTLLPLSVEKETFRAYDCLPGALSEEAAEQMLREQLMESLRERVPEEEGQIIITDFVARKADGFLEVTLLAECSQQIGREVPRDLPPEPLLQLPDGG